MGTINLKPGVIRYSKWTNDFNPFTQRQTHTQIWIRLMELPQEYWRRRTLFEIASAVGTPLAFDAATENRTFGHYARVLVDMDLSRHIFNEILVEREGYAFKVPVVYERLPDFCSHCTIIGHDISVCKWLRLEKEAADNKQIIKVKKEATRVMKYVPKAAESSAQPVNDNANETVNNIDTTRNNIDTATPENIQEVVAESQGADATKVNKVSSPRDQLQGSAYNMPLLGVTDEIMQGNVNGAAPILQRTDELVEVETINESDDEQNIILVPETQLTKVVNDEEFDAVVQKDLQVVKQIWHLIRYLTGIGIA
jgi:hypothetical protein